MGTEQENGSHATIRDKAVAMATAQSVDSMLRLRWLWPCIRRRITRVDRCPSTCTCLGLPLCRALPGSVEASYLTDVGRHHATMSELLSRHVTVGFYHVELIRIGQDFLLFEAPIIAQSRIDHVVNSHLTNVDSSDYGVIDPLVFSREPLVGKFLRTC